ncbi:MAG: hypothetical protein AAGA77_24810 [Bacteroidota bacterium]
MKTRKVAITGIDGCGKSTLIQELMNRCSDHGNLYQAFSCTNYHDTPNAPFSALSRAFDQLSQFADARNDSKLKYAALYLKMSLFGPIEQFFLNQFSPQFLITERQALVASLVYGQFYAQVNRNKDENEGVKSLWTPELLNDDNFHWKEILHWFELENIRLDRKLDLWQLPEYLMEVQANEPMTLLKILEKMFRTSLPEKIIYLQIDEEIAANRVGLGKTKEIHESQQHLKQLHLYYQKVLGLVGKAGVQTIVLPVGSKTPEAICLEVIHILN